MCLFKVEALLSLEQWEDMLMQSMFLHPKEYHNLRLEICVVLLLPLNNV